jgi:hypothetical protein
VRICRRTFDDFSATADLSNAVALRTHRKLADYLERAETDAAHAKLALERALDASRTLLGTEI